MAINIVGDSNSEQQSETVIDEERAGSVLRVVSDGRREVSYWG